MQFMHHQSSQWSAALLRVWEQEMRMHLLGDERAGAARRRSQCMRLHACCCPTAEARVPAGEMPPLKQQDWEEEFAKYRSSPEYQLVNSKMSLEQFKFIYWMEYAHRMWGRALGLVFAGPAVYFIAKGAINGPLAGRLGLLFLMGGAQVWLPASAASPRLDESEAR
jgi:hypothetical protein